MGIQIKHHIIGKTQDEFHAIDKKITGFSFDIHNEIGRFCNENIYQSMLLGNCSTSSIKAQKEVEIRVSYKDFTKTYFIDLLVDNGIIYELKTVSSLNDSHKQQLINYLLLTNTNHGKLINFRNASVDYQFVSTSLNYKDRFDFVIDTHWYEKITPKCLILVEIIKELLSEWGAFLDFHLYNEAVTYFLGGIDNIIFPVEIIYKNECIGKQKMQLLNPEISFHISAITRAFKSHENNIRRLIKHTKIKTVQWVNFNNRNITLKTIK